MQDALSNRLPLIVMTTFFAVLALNIAVPALVLSAMGFARWLVVREGDVVLLEGSAA